MLAAEGVRAGHGWGKHVDSGPRAFPLEQGPSVSAAEILEFRDVSSGSDTINAILETRRGVVRWADSEGPFMRAVQVCGPTTRGHNDSRCSTAARRRPSWGEDSFLSPIRGAARAPASQGGSARKSSAQRHLGASSPSGNARGRMAEWCTPLDFALINSND